jgi:cyclophilin family peptidyl-prolyl cis-trans isomerase
MYKIITQRIEFCKYDAKKYTYNAHKILYFIFMAIVLAGCSLPSSTPADYSDDFKAVHEAVTKRDGSRLMQLTRNDDAMVSAAAWRALASTPTAPTDSVLTMAIADGSDLAWFALSTRALSADQLRVLESHAFSTNFPKGLIRTLGLQGDETTAVLMDSWSGNIASGHELESEFALAMSRLAMRTGSASTSVDRLVDRAMQTTSPDAARSWLYALYRSNTLLLNSDQATKIVDNLGSFNTIGDADVRRTVFRVLAKAGISQAADLYAADELPTVDTRTAVDILRSLSGFADSDRYVKSKAIAMLYGLYRHDNPLVVGEALTVMSLMKLEPSEMPVADVEAVMETANGKDNRLYMRALSERLSLEPRLDSIDSLFLRDVAFKDPYLATDALMNLIYARPTQQVLAELRPFAKSDVHMHRMAAATVLNSFARSLHQVGASADQIAAARDVIWDMLSTSNRSLVYTLFGALRQSTFREVGDNDRTLAMLKSYKMPEDIEVYQAVLPSLLRDLGPMATILADSMASYDNAALNRVVMEFVSASVRERIESTPPSVVLQGPDWKLLRKLGDKPTLQIETEAGLIVVEMDPVRAPSTVTAIARLAEAGMYNGIPFHRVVPNFVIQGGDVETGDGFGGPDFVIPNEPSEHGFVRGAAGIASAGKDTEGSQYFFMIDWAPHLDGGYTVFGQVIAGMDVVERIRVGDRVIRARISNL